MIEDLLSRLEGVKSKRRNSWVAKCPAHDDNSPSLVITQADNGNILIHCFAGCTPLDILESVNLDLSSLFADNFLNRHNDVVFLEREARLKARRDDNSSSPIPTLKETLIVAEGRSRRAQGIRLSEEDMRIELEAFIRMKNE